MTRVRPADLQKGHFEDVLILKVEERRFAVCRTPLGYFVVHDCCPHRRVQLTRWGRLKEPAIVQCTAHGCQFDLKTGERSDSSGQGCLRLDLVHVDTDEDELILEL